jgi:hypothetical protein
MLECRPAATDRKRPHGVSDRNPLTIRIEYALVPGGLQMRVTTESTSHFGDKYGKVGGDPDAEIAEGLLQKVQ